DERRLPPRGLMTISIVGVVAIVGAVVAYSAGMFDRGTPAEPVPVTAAAKPQTEPDAAAPVTPDTSAAVAAAPEAAPNVEASPAHCASRSVVACCRRSADRSRR